MFFLVRTCQDLCGRMFMFQSFELCYLVQTFLLNRQSKQTATTISQSLSSQSELINYLSCHFKTVHSTHSSKCILTTHPNQFTSKFTISKTFSTSKLATALSSAKKSFQAKVFSVIRKFLREIGVARCLLIARSWQKSTSTIRRCPSRRWCASARGYSSSECESERRTQRKPWKARTFDTF